MRIKRWRELKDALAGVGFRPKSSLGQNFLMSPPILRQIVQKADLSEGDPVLEIGIGAGSLTSFLLDAGVRVLGVEIDDRLARIAQDNCSFASDRLRILTADALEKGKALNPELIAALKEFSGGTRYSLVANLPYSISTPIICELMKSAVRPRKAVVLVQEDFALRVCAKPGTHEFSPVAVFCSIFGKASIVRRVSPGEFWPVPAVFSSILHWSESEVPPRIPCEERLFDLVNAMFRYRRKTVSNSLRNAQKAGWNSEADLISLLEPAGINPSHRAEQLAPEQFCSLHLLVLEREQRMPM